MNEQTDKLIRDLAEKLGTTTEHLWRVLVKQAPISAITKLGLLVVVAIGILGLVKAFWFSFQKFKKADYGCEEGWVGCCVACVVLIIAGLVFTLMALTDLDLILAGFFNPEYWAFKQIHP